MSNKVGRNDPCPCGSGKKYKKCCETRLGPKRKFSASVLGGGLSSGTSLKGKATSISTDFFSKVSSEKKDLSQLKEKMEKKSPEEKDSSK